MKLKTLLDSKAGRDALAGFCGGQALSPETALKLVQAVEAQAGRARRRGLFDQIDEILTEGEPK